MYKYLVALYTKLPRAKATATNEIAQFQFLNATLTFDFMKEVSDIYVYLLYFNYNIVELLNKIPT